MSENTKAYTKLMYQCARGTVQEVKTIVTNCETEIINRTAGWNEVSALMIAASVGKTDIVEYLLTQGANCRLKNSLECNALMIAAEQGHLEIVKVLHLHDAETQAQSGEILIQGKTKYLQTALMLAIENVSVVNGNDLKGDERTKEKNKRLMETIEFIVTVDGEENTKWQLSHQNQFYKW